MVKEYNDFLRKNTNTRKYQLETVEEFLKRPLLYVPRKYIDDLEKLIAKLPPHKLIDEEKKPSVVFEFAGLDDRDRAKNILDAENIHYTSGKTLVPFPVLEYERHMYNHEFHRISYVLDDFIRSINKHWVNNVKIADASGDMEFRKQLIIDCLYACKIIAILVHPIAPEGCEMFREYLCLGEKLWDWTYILEPISAYVEDINSHQLKFLEPRVDFFKKHDCQLMEMR